jgi:hypothetical protein
MLATAEADWVCQYSTWLRSRAEFMKSWGLLLLACTVFASPKSKTQSPKAHRRLLLTGW